MSGTTLAADTRSARHNPERPSGLLTYAPYLGSMATAWLCCAAGYLPAGIVLLHNLICMVLVLSFAQMHRVWGGRRISHRALGQIHLLASAVPCLMLVYATEHLVGRAAMLGTALAALSYGLLLLNLRRILQTTAAFITAYALLLVWLERYEPDRISLTGDGLIAGTFILAALLVALLGGQIHKMRAALRKRTEELDRAVARLSALALQDDLTGLPNRRAMGERLAVEHARLLRGGSAFAVALVDVDHFKRVNDIHGHAGGDAALRAIARLGGEILKAPDLMGRWGGEEFLIVLPASEGNDALSRVDALRDGIEQWAATEAGLPMPLTVSVGVAVARAHQAVDHTIAAADAALYLAKHQGRNRVVCAEAS